MANLPETSNFDTGVYQLEITDPVEGGAGGISNAQAQALANRTLWLKDRTDDLETFIDQVADDLAIETQDRIDAINAILPYIPVRRGWINGINPGAGNPGDPVARGGSFTAAVIVDSPAAGTTVLLTMPTISTTDYKVIFTVESLGDINSDHDCYTPVFKKISATQFQMSIADTGTSGQNLKIHMDVIKI